MTDGLLSVLLKTVCSIIVLQAIHIVRRFKD